MVKFLIIRFSSIGDIVLTTPVIRCLKTQVEGAEVHYLTKGKFAGILKANPFIDKVFEYNDNFSVLIKELKKERFDYIIDLHRNIRTQRVKTALQRYSFSFNKLNIRKWLMVNFKINKLPDLHIVDRYMETLDAFSVENDNRGLDFFIPPNEEADTKILLPGIGKKFLIIVAGGGHFTKQIPPDKIINLIESLQMPVVLIGGLEDVIKADEIEQHTSRKIYNLCGKLTLMQSASIIKQAEIIISPDTGMMHIASAFKKKIYSFWSNTIPSFGMYPYMPGEGSEIFEVQGLKCRPCSKIGFRSCPKQHFNCMQTQNYQKLIDELTIKYKV